MNFFTLIFCYRITTQWKQDNNLPVMTWPAQSPDINIIENLWRYLKIRLQRRAHLIQSKKDLINTATSPQVIVQDLYIFFRVYCPINWYKSPHTFMSYTTPKHHTCYHPGLPSSSFTKTV
jgi:hypothetical protein